MTENEIISLVVLIPALYLAIRSYRCMAANDKSDKGFRQKFTRDYQALVAGLAHFKQQGLTEPVRDQIIDACIALETSLEREFGVQPHPDAWIKRIPAELRKDNLSFELQRQLEEAYTYLHDVPEYMLSRRLRRLFE